MKFFFFVLILISLLGCSTPKLLNDSFYLDNEEVNLFAFVGQKISIVEFNPNDEKVGEKFYDSISGETVTKKSYIMDRGFRCRYKIVKNVFNDPKVDTIDFVAYDHYGKPRFSEYDTVLLYVSKSKDGSYYLHQKYQFDYLEQNSNGIFYGYQYDRVERKKKTIFKNKRIASIENLFVEKKEEVFKSLFKENDN